MAANDEQPQEQPKNLDRPPRGASGRGHTEGFLELEEFNRDLQHPHCHKLYDKMYRTDGDVRQVVKLVSDPIISGTWVVEPYSGEDADEEEVRHADFVRWALWEQMEPNLLGHLQQALPILCRSGFVPFEEAWKTATNDGRAVVVPATLALRLPRTIQQFEQDDYGNLRRIKQFLSSPKAALSGREGSPSNGVDPYDDGFGGIWLEARSLVYYRLDAEGDNWEGVSLLRPAYKHWKYKDAIERIDAVAQEREALGVPICYPPMSATDPQLDQMEKVLKNIRTNEQSFVIMPGPKAGQGTEPGTGWLIELLGYDRQGSGRDPQPSLKYHTDKIAAAFISEFMRLGHGATGARATAQVQQDPFLMSVEALVGVIEQVLAGLVKKLIDYNFAGVTKYPKLKMSLVDSTSLSQLADYVLKLTQVGALLPDAQLEDFLRARGDLPPVDPESRKNRKKEDDQIRRDIVTGGGGNGDAFGANADPGKPHGAKPATKAAASGDRGHSREDVHDRNHVTLAAYDEATDRYFRRSVRDYERHIALDVLEDQMDQAPHDFAAACQDHVMDIAKGGKGDGLKDAIERCLSTCYGQGRAHVMSELGMDTNLLDRGANDRGMKGVKARAKTSAKFIRAAIEDAVENADLVHGDDNPAHAQAAGERAGMAAARRVGRVHGVGALLQGRHDMALESADFITGVRYTAILDRNTCQHCELADDGVIRALDDPVRIDRRPPNRHCESLASGHNQCRCFEVYVRNTPPGLVE